MAVAKPADGHHIAHWWNIAYVSGEGTARFRRSWTIRIRRPLEVRQWPSLVVCLCRARHRGAHLGHPAGGGLLLSVRTGARVTADLHGYLAGAGRAGRAQ